MQEHGDVQTIDTAAIYGDSEKILGQFDAGARFTLDTKLSGGFGSGASKDGIAKDVKNSQTLLKHNVDILYIHAPDTKTPLEESLAAVNEAHKSGFFKRFGLSNFKAEDVQKAYNISKEKGYILPSVYQGNYSAVARKQEELLFPTLRKLGISFYAYSPMAGGFLAKTKQQLLEGGEGRWEKGTVLGDMYRRLYNKPALLETLDEWESIAKEEGVSKAALAYRWVKYNSALKPEHGDAIIIGASKVGQLKETLTDINAGPLSDQAVRRIDEIWKTIEHEAPLDNYHQ